MKICDHLHASGRQTHGIALKRLFDLLAAAMVDELDLSPAEVDEALTMDKQHNKFKSSIRSAAQSGKKSAQNQASAKVANSSRTPSMQKSVAKSASRRQQRHSILDG